MPYEALTKERLTRALRRLSELATAEGIVLEIDLYGGAVFTLVYGSRDSTKDVDGILRPAAEGERLVAQVAREESLPDDWLNGDVRQFLSHRPEHRTYPSGSFAPGVKLRIPTAAYLLSLKLNACRRALPGYAGDEADIRFLLGKLKPASLAAVEEIHDRFYPGEGLKDRAVELVQHYLAHRDE